MKSRKVWATSLSTRVFYFVLDITPYFNQRKTLDLIERIFLEKKHFILPVTIRQGCSLLQTIDNINFGLDIMYLTPYRILLDNMYIRFGTTLYRQIVGIPMGTTCASHVAVLFLFCYEIDENLFMVIIKPIFLKHSTRLQEIWMVFRQ